MADIVERYEVRVEGDEKTFIFMAEPGENRLVIREEDAESGEDLCALSLADRDELQGFFEGLRRVLGAARSGGGLTAAWPGSGEPDSGRGRLALVSGAPAREATSRDDARGASGGDGDREAVVEAARRRNPNAFKAWSEDEERRVVERYRAGEPVERIAKEHQRSVRAIEMRLRKLGARGEG